MIAKRASAYPTSGAKHSPPSFHLGAPFGPFGRFFTNLAFFDFIVDFNANSQFRGIDREMTHPKEYIKES